MDSSEPPERALPLPAANTVRRLLEFLPLLEAPDFTFARSPSSPRFPADAAAIWGDDELTAEAHRFVQALYDLGFIRLGFHWGEWQDAARRYVDDPTRLAVPTSRSSAGSSPSTSARTGSPPATSATCTSAATWRRSCGGCGSCPSPGNP